jgi:hypothetical protein
VEARLGDLDCCDGYPTPGSAATLRDHLDYLHGVDCLHGVETFMN